MLKLRPYLRGKNLAGRKTVRFREGPKCFLEVIAEPAVDLARRKPSSIKQHLNLGRERADPILGLELSGKGSPVDYIGLKLSRSCWKLKEGCQFKRYDPLFHYASG